MRSGAAGVTPGRIAVHGASGSGKTSLASAIAERLGVAHIELDGLFHQSGWTERPLDEFRAEVAEVVDGRGGSSRATTARYGTSCGPAPR